MTTFKVTDQNHPLHGREFPEYTKFARYNGGVEWIPLLIGANQVKFFALCNLTEIKPVAANYRPAWEVNPRAIVLYVAPQPLVVKMPADLLVHIREAMYCELKAA